MMLNCSYSYTYHVSSGATVQLLYYFLSYLQYMDADFQCSLRSLIHQMELDNLIFLKILGYEKIFGVTFVLCLHTNTVVITFLLRKTVSK